MFSLNCNFKLIKLHKENTAEDNITRKQKPACDHKHTTSRKADRPLQQQPSKHTDSVCLHCPCTCHHPKAVLQQCISGILFSFCTSHTHLHISINGVYYKTEEIHPI